VNTPEDIDSATATEDTTESSPTPTPTSEEALETNAENEVAFEAMNEGDSVSLGDESISQVETSSPGPEWWQLDDGRWVVGDAGQIPIVVPLPAAPWSRPDIAIDGATFGSVTFRAASIRGSSHQLYGKPRQDSYAYRPTRCGKWLIGCVADGVSQGRRSHLAADIACRETTAAIADAIDGHDVPATPAEWSEYVVELPWQTGVDASSDAIVTEATEFAKSLFLEHGDPDQAGALNDGGLSDGDASKLMSTTAIVFVVATAPNAEGDYPYALAVAAGDSSAFILSGLEWRSITEVKNLGSEIASSAVHPLPARRTIIAKLGFLATNEVLVIMTDGIGDPLGSGTGVVGRFLGQCWQVPCDPLAFGAQVGFIRKTFVDDRTAFAIWTVAS
jgi:serine/threonine protein phosphatase PrpC